MNEGMTIGIEISVGVGNHLTVSNRELPGNKA
jgi:hypothetical protein